MASHPGLAPAVQGMSAGHTIFPSNQTICRMLRETIQHFLADTAQVDPAKFKQPGLRVAELGLDSLGLVEMLFEVEDRYGFQIKEPMRYMDMTFDEMVADIELAVQECNGGEPTEDGRATGG